MPAPAAACVWKVRSEQGHVSAAASCWTAKQNIVGDTEQVSDTKLNRTLLGILSRCQIQS